jgi:hypothetical protein
MLFQGFPTESRHFSSVRAVDYVSTVRATYADRVDFTVRLEHRTTYLVRRKDLLTPKILKRDTAQ